MEVLFYTTRKGRTPLIESIDKLPKQAVAHIYELLENVENYGFNAKRIDFRHILGKLWEMKMIIPLKGGYRIFYCMYSKDIMILLHGYEKKTQKAPLREIKLATERLKDFFERGL